MGFRFVVLGLLVVVCSCAGGETSSVPDPAATTSTTMAMTSLSVATATSTEPTTTTQVVTTTTTSQPTSTTTPIRSAIVLRGDGLGPLDFGTPTSTAMETLIELLGPPSPGDAYPYGGHPLRHVYWDTIGLSVIFSDYEFYRNDGQEHLAGWGHGPKPTGEPATSTGSWNLKTIEGMGISSTLADLQAAYGEKVVLEAASPCDGPPTVAYLTATESDDRGFRLFFYFDRETSEQAARILALGAGAGPGC